MGYYPRALIRGDDSASVDAFQRWRVSEPTTLFGYALEYDKGILIWNEVVSGGGQSNTIANSSSVQLTTGNGTSGSKIQRATLQYFRYEPGKSQQILLTGIMGALKANVRQRIGYFDDSNGLFFEQDGTNLKVVRRTYTSGSAVDNAINQSAWNLDKLDGTGPSGITIDTSKTQIFVIDFQWLGVGRVRFGFDIAGVIVYCHQILNANVLSDVYMTTPNLPLQYSIENTGAASGATTMQQICANVISEGGVHNERLYQFSQNNGSTLITVSTARAIISIRPKATFGGKTTRGLISPDSFGIYTGNHDIIWSLVYNPTFTAGGGALTWSSADTNSMVEYCVHGDANAGAYTGGTILLSGYALGASNAQNIAVDLAEVTFPLVLDYTGANPRALSLVMQEATGSASAGCAGAWNWSETR